MTDVIEPERCELVTLPLDPVRCPKRLELPAEYDSEGRVWPTGGIQRLTTIPLAHLLEAGVEVRWKLPNGTVIDQDTGILLVAARQADCDKGYKPVFHRGEPAAPAEPASPECKL